MRIQAAHLRFAFTYALVFTILLPFGRAGAQQRYLMEETTAEPKLAQQFETAQKDYCAVVVRGGAPSCLIFSPTTFSSGQFYLTLLAFTSFGHYDQGTYTSKGETPEQARELAQRRQPAIASNHESAISLRPEVSFLSSEPGSLALVTELNIRPGTERALLHYVQTRTVPQAHANHLLSVELYQTTVGGDTSRFLLLRRFNTFSQLDGLDAFGEDAGVGQERPRTGEMAYPADWLQRVRTTVMRVRTDLSAHP